MADGFSMYANTRIGQMARELPGTNLLRYNGQFAPMGRWRSKIVATARKRKTTPCLDQTEKQKRKKYSWAALHKRAFLIDVLQCTACGGCRELIAVIEQPKTVRRILDPLGIHTTPATFKPARPPPEELWPEHSWD